MFVLRKSDEFYLCVNYYELNVIIIKNCYSLSLTSELLDQVDDFIIFSKIDLQNAYHRICIWEDDEWKIIFCTQYRHFEYQIVLFDLTNAPAIFQVYINQALYDLVDNFCIIYLDNILIFSKFEEEHYQHLKLVIEHLWCAELYVNSKKYKFFKTEVEYLDFLVSDMSLHMNLSHVKTVSD